MREGGEEKEECIALAILIVWTLSFSIFMGRKKEKGRRKKRRKKGGKKEKKVR